MATVIPLVFREPTREVNLTRRTVEMILDILDPSVQDPCQLHPFISPGGEGWYWVTARVSPRNNVRAVQWIQRRCPDFWAGAIQGPVIYLSAQEQATMEVDRRVQVMPLPETLDDMVANLAVPPKPPGPLAVDPTVNDLFEARFNAAMDDIFD